MIEKQKEAIERAKELLRERSKVLYDWASENDIYGSLVDAYLLGRHHALTEALEASNEDN